MVDYVCAGCETTIESPEYGAHVVGQDLYFHTPGLVAGIGTTVELRTGEISNSPLKACYEAYAMKQWMKGNFNPIQLSFEPIKILDDIAHE